MLLVNEQEEQIFKAREGSLLPLKRKTAMWFSTKKLIKKKILDRRASLLRVECFLFWRMKEIEMA